MFADILTERLVLRRLLSQDADPLLRYRSDPEVARFQSWAPQSPEEIRAFIDSLATQDPDTPGAWYQIGIALRATGNLIGDIGLHVLAHDPRQVEIGITVAPEHQSLGFASEALLAVLAYVFDRAGKHRVYLSIDPSNHRCLALARRLGLRQEAHMVESLDFKGTWADEVIFALLAREWRSMHAR